MNNPSKLLEEVLEATETQLDRRRDYIDTHTKPASVLVPAANGIDESGAHQ